MPYRAERVDAVFLMSLRSYNEGKKILDDTRSFISYMCQSCLANNIVSNFD